MHVITFDCLEWQKSTCTCPEWCKSGVCKHVLGIAMIKNVAQPPPEANEEPLRRRKLYAHRRLAVKALQTQPGIDDGSNTTPQTKSNRQKEKRPKNTSSKAPQLTPQSQLPQNQQPPSSPPPQLAFETEMIEFLISEVPQSKIPSSMQTRSRKTKQSALPSSQPIRSAPQTQPAQNLPSKSTPATDVQLIAFGTMCKRKSLSVQCMSSNNKWSMLSSLISGKDIEKCTRSNASYTHVGDKRVVITGGIDSMILSRVSDLFFWVKFNSIIVSFSHV